MSQFFSHQMHGLSDQTGDTTSLKLDLFTHTIVDLQTNQPTFYEMIPLISLDERLNHDNGMILGQTELARIKKMVLLQLTYIHQIHLAYPATIKVTLSCLEDKLFVNQLLTFSTLPFVLEVVDIDANIRLKCIKKNIHTCKMAGIELWLGNYDPKNTIINATLGEIKWDRIRIDHSVVNAYFHQPDILSSFLFILEPFVTQGIVYSGIDTDIQANAIANIRALGQGYYYQYPKKLSTLSINQKGFFDAPLQESSIRHRTYFKSNYSQRVD